MSPWIDTVVVIIVIIGGIFIMYRALKEPIDAFFGLIGKAFNSLREKAADKKNSGGFETIEYG